MMSSRIINDQNVLDVAKTHKFQMTRAMVQQELAPRNNFDQVMSLEEQSAYKARNAVLSHVWGDHKNDVRF